MRALRVPSTTARAVLSGVLAVFVAYALWIGFSKGESYPFSTFPMYSVAKLDPYVVPTQKVFAYTADGEQYAVQDQGVRSKVRVMRRKIVLDEAGPADVAVFSDEMVRRINRAGLFEEDVVGIRVVEMKVQIRPMGSGDPLDPEVKSATVLIDSAPDNARLTADSDPPVPAEVAS